MARHAAGADVVIHNVIAASDAYLAHFPPKRKVLQTLASPEECGRVFLQALPRLAVFTHVITLDVSDDELIRRTRAAGYTGPLVIGEDRMVLLVDAQGVRVQAPAALDDLPDLGSPADSRLHGETVPGAGMFTSLIDSRNAAP